MMEDAEITLEFTINRKMVYAVRDFVQSLDCTYNKAWTDSVTAPYSKWRQIYDYMLGFNMSFTFIEEKASDEAKEMMTALKINYKNPSFKVINGKLTQDGEIIRIEAGNLRYINAIKQYEQIANDGISLEVEYETTIEASVKFNCNCGYVFHEEKEVDDDEYGEEEFEDTVVTCGKCNQSYRLSIDEDDVLIAKFYN